MRLKLFRAERMSEAMALVRTELGPEAVILNSRRVADGVEVTAALPPDQPEGGEAENEPVFISPDGPSPWGSATSGTPAWDDATAAPLTRHNLPVSLLRRLAGGALTARLGECLRFAPLPAGTPRPLLLAGPPGAGKTLTCVKLAARATLAGTPPLVISTDGARAGAGEQLAAFTRLLGVTLALAATPGALGKAIGRRGQAAGIAADQPVLIDTAGCDPFNAAEAAQLRGLALAAGAEMVLVLPGGLDAAEASDLAQAFGLLGARHLLPTRLDVTRRLGGVLAAAAAGLALTEGGTGPGATDGLHPIDPAWLAERLLSPPGIPPVVSPADSTGYVMADFS